MFRQNSLELLAKYRKISKHSEHQKEFNIQYIYVCTKSDCKKSAVNSDFLIIYCLWFLPKIEVQSDTESSQEGKIDESDRRPKITKEEC